MPGPSQGPGSQGSALTMGGKHARAGAPDLGEELGRSLSRLELNAREHYVTPSNNNDGTVPDATRRTRPENRPADLPYYYNNYDGLPVAYSAPSAQKERMVLKSAIRQAAGTEVAGTNTFRVDPIGDDEVDYLQSMKDQAELAKFDEYVETFIDPRQPGNMKWLMEIYPSYVGRRLQQAHTDYEYALRNQMIDSWGINTFDDLHFKYLVDQGKIAGPKLTRANQGRVDDKYTPGFLSPFNFQSPRKTDPKLRLPFASAQYGKKPTGGPAGWEMDRSNKTMGTGNDEFSLARGMYDQTVGPGTLTPLLGRSQDNFNPAVGRPPPPVPPPARP